MTIQKFAKLNDYFEGTNHVEKELKEEKVPNSRVFHLQIHGSNNNGEAKKSLGCYKNEDF